MAKNSKTQGIVSAHQIFNFFTIQYSVIIRPFTVSLYHIQDITGILENKISLET